MSPSKQRRSVRITGSLLLIIQAAILQLDWIIDQTITQNWTLLVTYIALGGLAILAALIFWFLHYNGWLLAMAVQSLSLITTLILYFQDKRLAIQIIMVYAILMVLYLNSYLVDVAFHQKNRNRGEI
ncbi:MAG: hypothetical protein AAF485_09275 [Chloroflexota bacterium]